MKLLKTAMLGLAAATLMGGAAQAQTLYIVGSTAFRPAATAAILAYLADHSNSSHDVYGVTSSANPASASTFFGAGNQTFENSTGSIVVKTNWTGSAAGLVDVTTDNTTQDKFIPTPAPTSANQIYIPGLTGGTGTTPSYGTTGGSNSETDAPTLSFCDSFKSSIAATLSGATITGSVGGATSGPALAAILNGSTVTNAGGSSAAGAQDAVGVIPFAWYFGNSSTSSAASLGISNITQQTALSLISGATPLSAFTGAASDNTNYTYLVGRNEDSGTRLAAFAEAQAGFGPGADQFELSFSNSTNTGNLTKASGATTVPVGGVVSGTNVTVTSATDFESDAQLYTEPKIGYGIAGHSGYASGGDVAKVLLANNNSPSTLNVDGNGGSSYFVGYLGFADGYALTNPSSGTSTGLELNYNGATPSVPNIQNGLYSFWAYEHMYYLTGTQPNTIGSAKTIADGIADNVYSTYAPTNGNGVTAPTTNETEVPPVAGITLGSMNVTRSQEGSVILF